MIDYKKQILRNNIKAFRNARNLSQDKLAEYSGLSQNTISDYENGKTGCTAYHAAILCDLFCCRFEDLFFLAKR